MTNDYWRERAKRIFKIEEKNDNEMIKKIVEIINEMIDDIEKIIYEFYMKYAEKEGLTYQEAKKRIDEFDVHKFRKKAKEYVENKDFSDKANHELSKYNTKMYISRERLLMKQLGLIITHAYAKLESQFFNYLESAYMRAIKEQAGVIGENVSIKPHHVETIVKYPFEGDEWSNRLWKQAKAIKKTVEKTVRHVIMRGRHPKEFVKELKKESGNTTYEAKRLLITETARMQTLAAKERMLKENGEDAEYEYIAKLDSKTSDTCRNLDGKVFKVKDMTPGENAPPMHPFCRSTVGPHINEEEYEEWLEDTSEKYDLDNLF